MTARDLRDLTLGELGEVIVSLDVGALSMEQLEAIGGAVRAELRRRRAAMPRDWFWRNLGIVVVEHALEELELAWARAAEGNDPTPTVEVVDDAS